MSDRPFDQDEQARSTGDVAVQETASVAGDAKEAGRSVARTTGEEARAVVGEARSQVASLYDSVRTDLADQAGTQQGRAADALRSFAGELDRMADGADQDGGMAAGLVRQAGDRMDGMASWLADRRPEDVLDEVRSHARRRPGTFLAVCALVGLVGGRLTRGLRDEHQQDQGSSGQELSAPVPAPVTPAVAGAPVPSYGGRPSADVPGSPGTAPAPVEDVPPVRGPGGMGYDVPPVTGSVPPVEGEGGRP